MLLLFFRFFSRRSTAIVISNGVRMKSGLNLADPGKRNMAAGYASKALIAACRTFPGKYAPVSRPAWPVTETVCIPTHTPPNPRKTLAR